MKVLTESTTYVFDGFHVDCQKRLLLNADNEPLPLAPKVYDTLSYLVTNAGKVIDKDELMSAIWTDTIVEENNLNKNISTLRRILGDDRKEHRYIVTIPGKGYKFVADVTLTEAERRSAPPEDSSAQMLIQPGRNGIGEGQENSADSNGRQLFGNEPNRFWLLTATAALCLCIILAVAYSWTSKRSGAPIRSVAVLPFDNASTDPDLEYLSEGLSEHLIDRLSELSQLKVTARASSFKFHNKDLDIPDVAQKLNVQAIVTGRIMKRGDELIIRVDLVDARHNKQLWGGEFTRKDTNAPELEGEIARTISNKLNLTLTQNQSKQLVERGTDDRHAYELLLKGDFLDRKGGLENITKAVEHYNNAIAIDPNYARAYARLSHAYDHLANDSLLDPKAAYPAAKAAAQKAVELDPSLADAHLQLASLARSSWDWTTAEREYVRALELNPNFAEARHRYSGLLAVLGKHDEAIEQARLARELDPQLLARHLALLFPLSSARRYDELLIESSKIVELDGNSIGAHFFHGIALAENGMYQEALSAFKEAARLSQTDSTRRPYLQIFLGAAYAWAGDHENARAILRSVENDKDYISPGELAILYVALGERERAFETLEKAFAARDLQLQYLNTPEYDPLRDDPRFQDLLRRVGLAR